MGREKHMLREAVMVVRQVPLTLEGASVGLGRERADHVELGRVAKAWIGERAQEHVVAFALDSRNTVIAAALLGTGGASRVCLSRLELLRFLLISGAVGAVLAHNHPSGKSDPSPEDLALTSEVSDGCKAVDLTLLDHLIVAAGSARVFSFRERGLMP